MHHPTKYTSFQRRRILGQSAVVADVWHGSDVAAVTHSIWKSDSVSFSVWKWLNGDHSAVIIWQSYRTAATVLTDGQEMRRVFYSSWVVQWNWWEVHMWCFVVGW